MKCRQFELEVADWARGRADAALDRAMTDHAAACSGCASLAHAERELRARVGAMPQVREPVDLWPRVSDRLAGPTVRRPLWLPARIWAVGGAAAVAVAWFMLLRAPTPVPSVAYADDQRVITMVSEMQSMPDPDRDPFISAVSNNRAIEQAVVAGYGDW